MPPTIPASGAGYVPPLLPTLVAKPPSGGAWIHEIKHDGYRTLLVCGGRAPSRATGMTGVTAITR